MWGRPGRGYLGERAGLGWGPECLETMKDEEEEELWGLEPALGIWGTLTVVEAVIPGHGRMGAGW